MSCHGFSNIRGRIVDVIEHASGGISANHIATQIQLGLKTVNPELEILKAKNLIREEAGLFFPQKR